MRSRNVQSDDWISAPIVILQKQCNIGQWMTKICYKRTTQPAGGSVRSPLSCLSPLGLPPVPSSLEPGGRCGLQWRPSICSSVAFLLTNTQATRVSARWGPSISTIFPFNLVNSRIWENKQREPPAKRCWAPDAIAQQTNTLKGCFILSF